MGYFNAIYASGLSHRARTVYMYLKDRADSQGQCWPGIRTIARDGGKATRPCAQSEREYRKQKAPTEGRGNVRKLPFPYLFVGTRM